MEISGPWKDEVDYLEYYITCNLWYLLFT